MKIRKFADKKKETFALIIAGVTILIVSLYVIYQAKGLANKVSDVFSKPASGETFIHFDFAGYEELIPPPPVATSTLATTTAATSTVPTSTTASSSPSR